MKYIYVFFCELPWHTCTTESDVNINVCTKFAYTCIAILVVYLGIVYLWKVFLSQVNSSDLKNNKFYMVSKYSRYAPNEQSINQFISEYVPADITYIIIISIYSCTIFIRTQITFEDL